MNIPKYHPPIVKYRNVTVEVDNIWTAKASIDDDSFSTQEAG